MLRSIATIVISLGTLAGSAGTAAEVDYQVIGKWLTKQQGATALQIDFSTTRRMRALKNPLYSKGRMWIDFSTRRFRWQDGNPPKTIVVNDGKRLTIAQPKRKRVEYRPATGKGTSGPASLSAIAGGFPKSVAEFQRRFRTLSTAPKDDYYRIRAQPISGEAAKGVAQIIFYVGRADFILRGYHATLRDGSSIKYDFNAIVRNPKLPASLFQLDARGYKVTN